MARALADRSRVHRDPRSRDAAGLPALEPGARAAASPDHDCDLHHPRRPDGRPLRRIRRGYFVAGRPRSPSRLARRRRPLHAHAPLHPRRCRRHRVGALALAEEDPHRNGDPPRRRRELAALFARRGDHRRYGLARWGSRRRAPARPRLELLLRLPAGELHLLLDHLHVRAARDRPRVPPTRVVREAGVSLASNELRRAPGIAIGLGILISATLAPLIFNTYWISFILTQVLLLGVAAASLIFLSAYGGMVSLAQVALYGTAGFVLGNVVTTGNSKGLNLGWHPWLGVVLGIAIATAVGLIFGALASRSAGIYFLMITLTFAVIANLFFGQVTTFSGFGGISGVRTPGLIGEVDTHPNRLYYAALVVAVVVYAATKYLVRTPFGITLQGVRDDPVRMSSLGYNVPFHRMIAFGFAAFIASLGGVLFVWWNGHIDPASIDLSSTIDLLVICVIGGLYRLEGAWLGALVFVVINNYIRSVPGLGHIGLSEERFHTVIGVIFLVIILLSPGGLMGILEKARELAGRLVPRRQVATAAASAATSRRSSGRPAP